jgi:hypothetical protein
MTFLSGLVTGLATSVDDVLKKDMERTQERVDGMAQYRVTRRRAALEAQEKEKKEIQDSINKLASLVGGDIDKGAQLYISGGQTVDGANALYDELKLSADNKLDINTIVDFTNERAEPGNMTSYVSKFVTPISTLPVSKSEAPGAGLYGALFKPDTQRMVERQVAEAAPIGDQTREALDITGATIDRGKMFTAVERERLIKEREQADTRFEREGIAFTTSQEQAKQAMDNVTFQQERLNRLDKANASQQEKDNARADLADAREEQRLTLAVAANEREAAKQAGVITLQGLSIEEAEFERDKRINDPPFATLELMYANALQQESKYIVKDGQTLSPADAEKLAEAQATQVYALNGLAALAKAKSVDEDGTGYESSFSDSTIEAVFDKNIKALLQPVGLIKDIEGQISYNISGNETDYYDRMARAFDQVEVSTAAFKDVRMQATLESRRKNLKLDVKNYKKSLLKIYQKSNDEELKGKLIQVANKTEAGSAKFINNLVAGDIVQYKNPEGATITTLWTGTRYQ